MKVLLITEYFPPIIHGGGEISAETLAKELAKNNIEVHVLTSKFKNLKRYEEINKVKVHRLLKTGENPRKLTDNLKRTFYLHKSIKKQTKTLNKKHKFNTTHFLNTTSITKIKGKTIATINNYTNFCPTSNLQYNFKPGDKNFINFLKHMIKSDYIGKQKLKPYLKYNPFFLIPFYINYRNRINQIKHIKKFIVLNDLIKLKNSNKIYNIVNINNKIIKYPIKKRPNTITYIGELEKIKGVDRLLKAAPKDTNILIVGGGSQKNYLKKIANKNTIFTGKINQKYIPHIYKISDIIVLPTRWQEPLSRTLTEALFFGKPILATDKGGNKEQVKHNINGFIIKSQKEFTEKLNLLTKNKKLREKMGKESRKLYNKNFKPDTLIKKIIEMYKK